MPSVAISTKLPDTVLLNGQQIKFKIAALYDGLFSYDIQLIYNPEVLYVVDFEENKYLTDILGGKSVMNNLNSKGEFRYHIWFTEGMVGNLGFGSITIMAVGTEGSASEIVAGFELINEIQQKKSTGSIRIPVNSNSESNFPNFLSPNGDGINDIFRPISSELQLDGELQIYDILGNLVFENLNIIEWDGNCFNGHIAREGVYYYFSRSIGKYKWDSGCIYLKP